MYIVRKNKRKKIKVAVDIIIISPLSASFCVVNGHSSVQWNENSICKMTIFGIEKKPVKMNIFGEIRSKMRFP